MRHATVYAIEVIQRLPARAESQWEAAGLEWQGASDVRACDWLPLPTAAEAFRSTTAAALLRDVAVELPTCPSCAALVDLAFAMRGST